ncbi:benzoate/H(+) symporter BenE family transporter, partial [Salmonella enterica]|uniref:benzoate/H(+) symporter BenE family transporter n=1 Tax=Salmonella enterica TaxID=28901 RepID=UPI002159E87F
PFCLFFSFPSPLSAPCFEGPGRTPVSTGGLLGAAGGGCFVWPAWWLGGCVTRVMAALPVSWVQMLAGLALLSTISGSLYQALTHESERDAAVIAFLVTASGLTLMGIGSAFWGLIAGGIGYAVLTRTRRTSLSG